MKNLTTTLLLLSFIWFQSLSFSRPLILTGKEQDCKYGKCGATIKKGGAMTRCGKCLPNEKARNCIECSRKRG